jgi:hypothetical protein
MAAIRHVKMRANERLPQGHREFKDDLEVAVAMVATDILTP